MKYFKWILRIFSACFLIAVLIEIEGLNTARAYGTYRDLRQNEGCGYSWEWNGECYSCTGPCYWAYVNYGYEQHCKMISHYSESYDEANEDKVYWDQVVNSWENCTKEPIPGSGYPPTCTKYGEEDTLKCIYCREEFSGHVKTIPATGHQLVSIEGVEATCTEAGLTDSEYCSVCNEVIKNVVQCAPSCQKH